MGARSLSLSLLSDDPRGYTAMAKVGDVFQVFINTVTIKVAGTDNGGALAMLQEHRQ
jgi:hypothetical protein